VLYVISQGAKSGYVSSVYANAGIVSGNIVYFVISATGLGAILIASQQAFDLIRWGGAFYLIYLGLMSIRKKSHLQSTLPQEKPNHFKIYKTGLVVQLASPKNLVYFMAILPQFLNPAYPLAYQVLIFGLTSVTIEAAILMIYGSAGSRIQSYFKQRTDRFYTALDRISGVLLIGIGTSLLFLGETDVGTER
jgi:homoserine/homoserine lactone efflux protein